jgi:hypothetical protein
MTFDINMSTTTEYRKFLQYTYNANFVNTILLWENVVICEISGSHGGEYEDASFLAYTPV